MRNELGKLQTLLFSSSPACSIRAECVTITREFLRSLIYKKHYGSHSSQHFTSVTLLLASRE